MIAFRATLPEERTARNEGNGLAGGSQPSARYVSAVRNPVSPGDIHRVYQLPRLRSRRLAPDDGTAKVQGVSRNG
jgi:hypothetical protein